MIIFLPPLAPQIYTDHRRDIHMKLYLAIVLLTHFSVKATDILMMTSLFNSDYNRFLITLNARQ